MKIFPQSARDIESRGDDLNVTQRLCQDSQGIKQICERFFTYTKEYYERQQHKVPEEVQIFTSDLRVIGECWKALDPADLAMQILNGGSRHTAASYMKFSWR